VKTLLPFLLALAKGNNCVPTHTGHATREAYGDSGCLIAEDAN
jgi:hypothetical protein